MFAIKLIVLFFVLDALKLCYSAPTSASDNTLNKTVPEIITSSGYQSETHYVITPDGYILCLHRIPAQTKEGLASKVIFLQHGLLSSTSDWVLYGPGNSLAFILADKGWDVWMGNIRGNFYSRNHTTYNPDKDAKFWDFSWSEIGEIDLPAMIDYVLDYTEADSLYYIGHSQGTTAFFAMASENPEYNRKIKLQLSLAPIAFMNHLVSPVVRTLAAIGKFLNLLLAQILGINEIARHGGLIQTFAANFCSENEMNAYLCRDVLFLIVGFDSKGVTLDRIPNFVHHYPNGCSIKQLVHYAQEMNSGHFRKYEYGLQGNMKKYGQVAPPDYDLSKITAPVYLFYSKNDWLSAVKDVQRLYDGMTNSQSKHLELVKDDDFNHMDFVYGNFAPKLVYENVTNLIAAN